MAFHELRQYKVLPKQMDAWVKVMQEEIIPFQISKGMVICGSFRGETDENPIQLARKFREMAGFSNDEIDDLSEVTAEAQAEAEAAAVESRAS